MHNIIYWCNNMSLLHNGCGNAYSEGRRRSPEEYEKLVTPTEKKNGTIYGNQSYFLYKCLK